MLILVRMSSPPTGAVVPQIQSQQFPHRIGNISRQDKERALVRAQKLPASSGLACLAFTSSSTASVTAEISEVNPIGRRAPSLPQDAVHGHVFDAQ
jgi:hypothetical protein